MSENTFEHNPKSAWEIYSSKKDRDEMEKLAREYLDFLTKCKTERETIDYVVKALEDAGFTPDFHSKKAFRVFKGKTIFMARKGKRPLSDGVRILGAHADAPRLDFKQHPLYEDWELALAKTHYYGGIRKYQWLARPLSLHGVVVKQSGEVVQVSVGEENDDPVFTITDLLPHLAYEQVKKNVTDAFQAEKLNVIIGHNPDNGEKDDKDKKVIKSNILKLLNDKYGIIEEDLFSAEMQVVPAGPARYVGLDSAMIGGYGQDDRACVFTALKAFLHEHEPEYSQVVLFWDKEEIGSDGSTGAKSLFFEYCLEDLIDAWDEDARISQVFLNSKAISADVHVGTDPDHLDVYEPLNASKMGYGPVFSKYTGHRGKVGANDAHPEFIGFLRKTLNEAGVPWQMAGMGKVDLGGGGTVAKFLAVYGMDIIDMGPSVLSMHSPFEITSKADIYATMKAFEAFLKA